MHLLLLAGRVGPLEDPCPDVAEVLHHEGRRLLHILRDQTATVSFNFFPPGGLLYYENDTMRKLIHKYPLDHVKYFLGDNIFLSFVRSLHSDDPLQRLGIFEPVQKTVQSSLVMIERYNERKIELSPTFLF